MKKFLFKGTQVIRVTLQGNKGREQKDVCLVPGELCELPADNTYVLGLIKKGLLVEEPTKEKKQQPSKSE